MLSLNPAAARFLDKKNLLFKELHGTLDNLFRCLQEDGVGRQVKCAEVITKQEEVQLWESGELGTKDPRMLCSTATGKTFACGEELNTEN